MVVLPKPRVILAPGASGSEEEEAVPDGATRITSVFVLGAVKTTETTLVDVRSPFTREPGIVTVLAVVVMVLVRE